MSVTIGRPISPAADGGRRGFSLVELLVVLSVVTVLMTAIVSLFDLSGRIARVQTNVADMQQSLRIAQYDVIRYVRMAGRGGLPRGTLPGGLAMAVRNDVPETGNDARVAPTNANSPEAVAGSDVLVVRGVLTTPIYQVNPAAGALTLNGSPPTAGAVQITNPSPSGVPQDLQPLIEAVQAGRPEALLLVSPLGGQSYAVVELDPDAAGTDVSDAANISLGFKVSGGTHTAGYLSLSPGGAFPGSLRTVTAVGLLEEHRYYVREEFEVPGDDTTEPAPRLARARVYPGTDAPHGGNLASLTLDIADDILDLQVAFGVDVDGDLLVEEANPPSAADEWVFNSSADDESDASQVSSWNTLPSGLPTQLYYLRVTTVARTGRRDVRYVSPPLGQIEDRNYGESATPSASERAQRAYRRHLLSTIIDLRNVS